MNLALPEYLDKAALLASEEQIRVLSRMKGQLPKRLQKSKSFSDALIAFHFEFEEEKLSQWRMNLRKMRGRNQK